MNGDLVLGRIGEGVALHHAGGDRDGARELFAQVWEEIGGELGDPLHVCVLAHSMADVQDDVEQELVWDLRALAVIDLVTDERILAAGVPMTVDALRPSLHLNLADCYRRIGDPARAREHLRLAQDGMGALGDDDYGRLIRDGRDRLVEQLSHQPAAGSGLGWPPG
jgi:hypothetical protein